MRTGTFAQSWFVRFLCYIIVLSACSCFFVHAHASFNRVGPFTFLCYISRPNNPLLLNALFFSLPCLLQAPSNSTSSLAPVSRPLNCGVPSRPTSSQSCSPGRGMFLRNLNGPRFIYDLYLFLLLQHYMYE